MHGCGSDSPPAPACRRNAPYPHVRGQFPYGRLHRRHRLPGAHRQKCLHRPAVPWQAAHPAGYAPQGAALFPYGEGGNLPQFATPGGGHSGPRGGDAPHRRHPGPPRGHQGYRLGRALQDPSQHQGQRTQHLQADERHPAPGAAGGTGGRRCLRSHPRRKNAHSGDIGQEKGLPGLCVR